VCYHVNKSIPAFTCVELHAAEKALVLWELLGMGGISRLRGHGVPGISLSLLFTQHALNGRTDNLTS
jgi:hypothetical protein